MRNDRLKEQPFQVWDASDEKQKVRWQELWRSWPKHDIFAHPDLAAIYAAGGQRAMAVFYKAEKGCILYPFVKRSLGALPWVPRELASFCDTTTSYGYGGAYYWGADEARSRISELFWKAYDEWARQERCVSEFIRFHLFDDDLAAYPGEKVERNANIVRSLTLTDDALWMDFEHKVRKNIKKARRSGLTFLADENGRYLEDFLRIYDQTMKRRNASGFYYFGREYFEALSRSLGPHKAYFHVLDGGRIVSTELVLYSSQTAYSFLGGTEDEAFDKRPNDLLKYEIMGWARARGIKNYCLGGGYEPDDGIYRYKLSFAPEGELRFFTGQRVIDEARYNELMSARERFQGGWAPREGYFPRYRS
ncbi:MAG: GNAT family N-acetyltransferase [Candidatus Omnitrophota bacterium]